MLDDITKKRINTLRQILVGKLPDPKAQVEQITNGLIYKFMNDMDEQSLSLGGKATYFSGKYQKYSWENLLDNKITGVEKVSLYSEAIEKMYSNENLPELFREMFKNSFLPFKDPSTLNMFLKEINEFNYSNSEKLGDAYEYLLSFMGSQGEAGQFRTPRHIIDFIVQIVNPKKNENILDPACGTAGFLISSYKHILNQNTKNNLGDGLTASDRKTIDGNLNGYDISPDMVKMSLVNMYLHKFTNPKIDEYDTLSSEDKWNEYYDVILANPPFFSPKGGIIPHNRFRIKSKKAEVLFIDYILTHLKPNGRAGIIVPEGINFTDNNQYVELRKKLIKEGLVVDISLPHGVFKPYASVKTHIMIVDKLLSKQTNNILFIEIDNDGYTQTDTRRPIEGEQLSESFEIIIDYFLNKKITRKSDIKGYTITKDKINSDDTINLLGRFYNYKNNSIKSKRFESKPLKEICKIKQGKSPNLKTLPGNFQMVIPAEEIKTSDHYDFDGNAVCIPLVSSAGHGLAQIKRLHFVTGKFALANTMCALFVNDENQVDPKFLYLYLSNKIDELLLPLMKGATNITMDIDQLSNIPIPIPSLEFQKILVNELNTHYRVADSCTKIIKNFKPSIDFDESYKNVSLGELCDINGGKRLPKGETFTNVKTPYPYLRVSDFYNYSINENKIQYISKTVQNQIKKYTISNEDIYISIAGSIGLVGRVPKHFSGSNLTENAAKIKIKNSENVLTDYIMYILSSAYVQSQIEFKTYSAGVPKLGLDRIKSLNLPICSISKQKQIVDEIEYDLKIVRHNKELLNKTNKIIKNKVNSIISE